MRRRPFTADELPPDSGVPDGVKALKDEFWVCGRCRQTFWQGGQYSVAMVKLSDRLSQLLPPAAQKQSGKQSARRS